MSKCDFNKVAKQFYGNHTSTWCSPVNLLHIFRTPFSKSTPGWLLLNLLIWVKHSKGKSFLHIFKTKIAQNFKQEVISYGLVEEFGNAKLRKHPKIQNKEQTVPVFFLPLNFIHSWFELLYFLWSFFMSRLSDCLSFSNFSFEVLKRSSIKAIFNSSRIA